jgi:SAM-dependent methyltransferase
MPSDVPIYESIGRSYSTTRREDPRIAARILDAVGSGSSVVNVGAGTGNYEPSDQRVVAVEPSPAMIAQRTNGHPLVRGVAESLPFPDGAFDVGLAILTIHHWSDPLAGLRELRRVSRRQVVVYFDHTVTSTFWAMDYFPTGRASSVVRDAAGADALGEALEVREVRVVPIPADCVDGFGTAYWARPEAYTDPTVQAGMSWLALLSDEERAAGTEALRRDLESGAWQRRHGHLLEQAEFDGGHRLAIAGETGLLR